MVVVYGRVENLWTNINYYRLQKLSPQCILSSSQCLFCRISYLPIEILVFYIISNFVIKTCHPVTSVTYIDSFITFSSFGSRINNRQPQMLILRWELVQTIQIDLFMKLEWPVLVSDSLHHLPADPEVMAHINSYRNFSWLFIAMLHFWLIGSGKGLNSRP